ncbi:MAG: hypothetical protein NTX63_02380 [Candidatus Peregrinibacteria bacterium]|nr:hypothetical protein [Candidatus Peregrinibacteria bacterium]
MNQIEKFFKKIPKKDRIAIEKIIAQLLIYSFDGLDIKKIVGHKDIYRVRSGKYRIIYHDLGNCVLLQSIRKRNESTYDDI